MSSSSERKIARGVANISLQKSRGTRFHNEIGSRMQDGRSRVVSNGEPWKSAIRGSNSEL